MPPEEIYFSMCYTLRYLLEAILAGIYFIGLDRFAKIICLGNKGHAIFFSLRTNKRCMFKPFPFSSLKNSIQGATLANSAFINLGTKA